MGVPRRRDTGDWGPFLVEGQEVFLKGLYFRHDEKEVDLFVTRTFLPLTIEPPLVGNRSDPELRSILGVKPFMTVKTDLRVNLLKH